MESKDAERLVGVFLSLMEEGKFDEAKRLLVTEKEIEDYPEAEKILPLLTKSFEGAVRNLREVKEGTAFGDNVEIIELRFHEIKLKDTYKWPSTDIHKISYHLLFRCRHEGRETKTNNRSYLIVGKTQNKELKIFLFD